MTGYGMASLENEAVSVQIELRTLNSKFLDIATKLPKELAHFENELRKKVSEQLQRGKINFGIEWSQKSTTQSGSVVNKELFKHYQDQLRSVSSDLNLTDADVFHGVMRLPDIFEPGNATEEIVSKDTLFTLMDKALDQCNQFRAQEGEAICRVLEGYAKSLAQRMEKIKLLDPKRIENIKSRINGSLHELLVGDQIDSNRFEQELIYYIEKVDISEEIVRLDNHIRYFLETLILPDSHGKKLGFISQEMGREINTIGSKANDSSIQKLVVEMKDELEKIKEQILNIV